MTNSGDASGCFSGMLRRLLCTGNLPTHPSDSLTESTEAKFDMQKTEAKRGVPGAERGPGVVAKLMGLNSLPDSNWLPKQRAPDAVSRSKSVNFADYLLEFDLSQACHRRVKTSSSFREVTPFLNPQNDLLVVYMNNFDNNKNETASNVVKSETGMGEVKAKKEQSNHGKKNTRQSINQKKTAKLKDEPRREIDKNCSKSRNCRGSTDSVSVLPSYKQITPRNGRAVNVKSTQKKPTPQKEACRGYKQKKKKTTTKKKNIRHAAKKTDPKRESDPENSSPISVLNVDGIEFSDGLSSLGMAMRGKEAKYGDNQREEDAVKKEDHNSKSTGGSDCYSEAVERICRLAEEDIREANWSLKNAYEFEGFEELCRELERHVVNVLLVQTMDGLFVERQPN